MFDGDFQEKGIWTMSDRKRQVIGIAVVCAVMLAGGLTTAAWAQDKPAEAELIATLKSGEADWAAKHTACRMLRQVGTTASVPALAALLGDEKLSHAARYALEGMPFPEVDATLRNALGTTQGLQKMGMVISLGVRRDGKAVGLLVPLMKSEDTALACAAAASLGRIGTPDAVTALRGALKGAPKVCAVAIMEGLLAASQQCTDAGQGQLAVPVLTDLVKAGQPMHIRLGAFRGLAFAQPAGTQAQLTKALSGTEPLLRDLAAQLVVETSTGDVTRAYAAGLKNLPAGGQEALIRALASLKDPAARSAVAAALQSGDRNVKLAAVKALAVLGSAAEVKALAALMIVDDEEMVEQTQSTLVKLRSANVDATMAGAIAAAAPALRVKLLETLASRQAAEAVPQALACLKDANVPVRVAALDVIAQLGGREQAATLVACVTGAKDSDELDAAENALSAISNVGGAEVLPLALKAMEGAKTPVRLALLRTVARIGGAQALATTVAALDDGQKEISDEALRLMSDWPAFDAAPHLKKLAQSADSRRQILGMRGYVRLVGAAPSAEKKIEMLTAAMAMAKRPEEKKLVLGAWGQLPLVQSLDVLLPYLDDAAVRSEAAVAIVAVAPALGKKGGDAKTRAAEALKTVVAKCQDAGIRDRATKALEGLK